MSSSFCCVGSSRHQLFMLRWRLSLPNKIEWYQVTLQDEFVRLSRWILDTYNLSAMFFFFRVVNCYLSGLISIETNARQPISLPEHHNFTRGSITSELYWQSTQKTAWSSTVALTWDSKALHAKEVPHSISVVIVTYVRLLRTHVTRTQLSGQVMQSFFDGCLPMQIT